jgi:hypothetical protein
MNVNSSEVPEDQELTEAAALVIVLLPVEEIVDAWPSDRLRYAIPSLEWGSDPRP